MDRRRLLAGLAGLPFAGAALPPLPAVADPFTGYHGAILALHDAIDHGDGSDEDKERLMDRWGEIDALAKAGRPTTLAGALGAVEYARRELHQFHIEGLPVDGSDAESVSGSDLLILHLLDGALGVLRRAVDGGIHA